MPTHPLRSLCGKRKIISVLECWFVSKGIHAEREPVRSQGVP